MVGKPIYSEKPALAHEPAVEPATNKADFELFSLAVTAINGARCASARTRGRSSTGDSRRIT